jgi:hypothetical protein
LKLDRGVSDLVNYDNVYLLTLFSVYVTPCLCELCTIMRSVQQSQHVLFTACKTMQSRGGMLAYHHSDTYDSDTMWEGKLGGENSLRIAVGSPYVNPPLLREYSPDSLTGRGKLTLDSSGETPHILCRKVKFPLREGRHTPLSDRGINSLQMSFPTFRGKLIGSPVGECSPSYSPQFRGIFF